MVRDSSKSRWPEVRERIKLNWSLIDDEEIDSLKGRLDLLSDKIQQVYDYSKERADREMLEFKRELNPRKESDYFSTNKPIIY